MQISYKGVALCLRACAVFAASVRAGPDYVARPRGWFILVPPLSKPDPLTGARSVDERASQKRWSAMVIRGRDGHDYDFAGEDLCKGWLVLVSHNLYYNTSATVFPSPARLLPRHTGEKPMREGRQPQVRHDRPPVVGDDAALYP